MRPKVIKINFKRNETGAQARMSQWTREELRAWNHMGQETSAPGSRIVIMLAAVLLHGLIFWAFTKLKAPHILDQSGNGNTAQVTLLDGSQSGSYEKGIPEPQPFPNLPADTPVITGPSTSSGANQKPKAETSQSAAKTSPNFGPVSGERRIKIPTPEIQPEVSDLSGEPSAPPTGIGFSKNLRNLLPNSESEYVASQRRIGSTYGKGAVGGDLEQDSQAPVGYKAPDKGKVSVTRYDYASYFLSLDRRFSEAWGGTRILPRGSTFTGTVGEFIEYDVIINRNGTLSKIVNVTQKKQQNRDFSTIDRLVNEVFSNVFPMNPVPERIKEDPLILRKRIQFSGYQYFMF